MVISFFELNKGKDQFVNFVRDREGWQNCQARLLATHIGGGHHPYGIHRILKQPVSYCTILRDPLARQISEYWYAWNGKNGAVTRGASVSTLEALVQQGVLSLDEWVSESLGAKNLFVQMLSGHSVVDETSLEIAQRHLRQHIDGVVSGWAVNLTRPEQKVPLEVRIGTEVVASGWSGEYRPDVAGAGYPGSYAGFSIPLPASIQDGFHVAIANSPETLHNAGIWRQGWHCA